MSTWKEYLRDYKKEHYASIYMEVYPEEKEKWKAAAAAIGSSLQGYIRETVNRRIRKEKDNENNR